MHAYLKRLAFRGIIMGKGLAPSEETLFDPRSGRIMNPSLAEYHMPVHLDVPEIDVMWTDIPDPQAPLGARGIGEIGITGTAAAIANAVFNATGKRVRDLPITLDKVLCEALPKSAKPCTRGSRLNASRKELSCFANIPSENDFLLDAESASGTVAEIQQH